MHYTNRFFTATGFLCGCLLIVNMIHAEEKDLTVGDMAPDFCCEDDKGCAWESREHVGKKIIVLYFYPSDFAFCCTRQATKYRDNQANFDKHHTEVIGISGDAIEAHREFKAAQKLTQTLLADTCGKVGSQFGVPMRNGGKAIAKDADNREILDENGRTRVFPRTVSALRQTFIIGLDGRIIYHQVDVSAIRDSQEVLEFICRLDVQ